MGDKIKHHDPSVIYSVYVLWLIGFTKSFISKATQKTEKQIDGIIARSEFSNRAEMSDEDRSAHLSELEAMRYEDDEAGADKGILGHVEFKIRKLSKKQTSGLARLKSRMKNTKPGRDGLHLMLDAEDRKRLLSTDKNAGALEYLLHEGKLAHGGLDYKQAFIRFDAGLRLRGYFLGAEIGSLTGRDLSDIRVDGGKGFQVGDHQSDCMAGIRKCRANMPGELIILAENVCVRDMRGWANLSDARANKFFKEVCMALDWISWVFGDITSDAFKGRWGHSPAVNHI